MTGKLITLLGLGLALSSSPALAASINPSQIGSSCGELGGSWHFVNPQSGTQTPGTLTATWTSGDVCNVVAYKVTPGGTQHFSCEAAGALVSAATDLNGRLVLSDFTCDTPPKCVPDNDKNTEYCGDGIDNNCNGTIDEKECVTR